MKYGKTEINKFNKLVETYFIDTNKPWTVSGLCIHLDIVRETLLEYEKKDNFSDTIKKAKLRIENFAENKLFEGGNVTGIIFNLKNNFKWKDKQEIEATNDNTIRIILDEQIKEWAE